MDWAAMRLTDDFFRNILTFDRYFHLEERRTTLRKWGIANANQDERVKCDRYGSCYELFSITRSGDKN